MRCVKKIETDIPIPARRQDVILVKKRKRNYQIVDFAVPTEPRMKLKGKTGEIPKTFKNN